MADEIYLKFLIDDSGFDKTSVKISDITDLLNEQEKAIKATYSGTQLDEVNKKLGDQTRIMQANLLKYNDAGKALKAMQDELATMAAAGATGTKAYENTAKAVVLLNSRVEESRGLIKSLSTDAKLLDTLTSGMKGVNAAFEVGAGLIAATGSESKKFAEISAQVQGALNAATAMQEGYNAVTEDGGLVAKAAAAAQGAYAFVVGESTGVMKAFRLALAGTGIGLAVIAIGELVAHWDEFTKAVGLSNKNLVDFEAIRKEAGDNAVSEAGKVELLIEKYKNVTTTQKERKKIIAELKEQSPAYFGALQSEKTSVEDLQAAYAKYSQALVLKAQADILAREIAKNNVAINEENNKSIDETLNLWDHFKAGMASLAGGMLGINTGISATTIATEKHEKATDKLRLKNDQLAASLQSVLSQLNKMGDPSAKATGATRQLTAAVEKQIEQLDVSKLMADFKNKIGEGGGLDEPMITEKMIDETQANADRLAANLKASYQQYLADKEEYKQASLQLEGELMSGISNLQTSLTSFISGMYENRLVELENNKQAELATAEGNAEQKKQIEQKYAIEQAKIKRQQAAFEKAAAIVQIGINLAQAIQKITAEAAVLTASVATAALAPMAYAQIPIVGASAAFQIATIAAKPLPEVPVFEKGGPVALSGGRINDGHLHGRSHRQGGMLINAQGGEYIWDIPTVKKHGDLIRAAHENRLEDLIMHKYIVPAIQLSTQPVVPQNTYDDFMLRATIKQGHEKDRRNAQYIADKVTSAVTTSLFNKNRYL